MRELTLIAYVMPLIFGISISFTGVLLIDIARSFQVPESSIGFVYTLLTLGMTIATLLNGRLLRKFSIKRLISLSIFSFTIGLIGILTQKRLFTFGVFFLAYGLGLGFFNYLCYYLIVHLYPEARASKLSFINFFFSAGAITGPIIASFFLKFQLSWRYVYTTLFIAIFFMLFLLLTIKEGYQLYEDNIEAETTKKLLLKSLLSPPVLIIGICLLVYTVAEIILSYWLAPYFRTGMHLDASISSIILSVFWIFMAIGRLVLGNLKIEILPEKIVLISSGIGSILLIGMVIINTTQLVPIAIIIALMGFFYSSINPCLMAYGTRQKNGTSPELMALFIFCGNIGGVAGSFFSSLLKNHCSIQYTVLSSGILLVLIFILITSLTRGIFVSLHE